LIALVDENDAHQVVMLELLRGRAGRLVTTWPLVTETSHMLDIDVRATDG